MIDKNTVINLSLKLGQINVISNALNFASNESVPYVVDDSKFASTVEEIESIIKDNPMPEYEEVFSIWYVSYGDWNTALNDSRFQTWTHWADLKDRDKIPVSLNELFTKLMPMHVTVDTVHKTID